MSQTGSSNSKTWAAVAAVAMVIVTALAAHIVRRIAKAEVTFAQLDVAHEMSCYVLKEPYSWVPDNACVGEAMPLGPDAVREAILSLPGRRPYPVFDIAFQNTGAEGAVLNSLVAFVSWASYDQGDTGQMPVGAVIPTATDVVLELPSLDALPIGDHGSRTFDQPVPLNVPVEPMSLPAGGPLRLRLHVVPNEASPSGSLTMRLRFGFSNGNAVTSEPITLRLGEH